ncbi:IF2 family translation initiation factor [Mycobacterium sp. Aquia_216]|uniref:IF2 family translation initiation factor n=1 Tax=Mycobacterium sp. Aquia_216 TaxID=2991729 RepID=UPI00227B0048|nr:IF2 family translation initiation factor [Mycobacterium sp. Aquia_216]WAJ45545.1 IF2 family translation initiation factor [Mycobacterium sp. Aquia_216]
MKISDVPFAVLRFQYQLARYPLQLIEDRVITRIGTEAPARLMYERSLGTLDAAVGNALGDAKLAERGAALVERTETLGRAATLEAKAAARLEQADNKLKTARDSAIEDRQQAQAATEQEIKQAREAAQDRKREAIDSAHEQSAAAKRQADRVAADRKEAAESARRHVQTRTRAAEKAASKVAESKLDGAREKRSEAAGKRAEANRLEELAHAEKEKRQAERAND